MPTILLLALVVQVSAAPPEVLAEIRIHGNLVATEADVLSAAGVRRGMPITDGLPAEIAARLRATGRFERVEVLKRYASIADPTQILLVIVVDEGRVTIERARDPDGPYRAVRKRGPGFMFMPLLDAEDGYGWAYGLRTAIPEPAGDGSQLAFPLTWGGDKRAAVEFEKRFAAGPVSRVEAGAHLRRREHPLFEQDDDRRRAWVRAERALAGFARVGTTLAAERVSFLGSRDRFIEAGVDFVVDTRRDPMLARNAVYGRAAWDHLEFATGPAARRLSLEARGYVGLVGQTVLAVRALRDSSTRPLPAALRPLLGGLQDVRGLAAGSRTGDTRVAASAEILVPITSPLSVGKVGVSAFADVGAIYDHPERLRKQRFVRGTGGSVWMTATFVRLNLAVARVVGGSTRVHFGTTVSF